MASLLLKFLPHLLVAAALLLAGLWVRGVIYDQGWNARDAEWKADTAKREEYGRAERKRMQMAYDQIEIAMAVIDVQQSRKREIETREVIKWRTEYRENPDTGKCTIPAEFVCGIDTAYSGMPETAYAACLKNTPSGGLSDRGILSWGQEVKRICTGWRDEVLWLREHYDKVQAVQ